MKNIAIMGAMNIEIQLLKEHMDLIKKETFSGFNFIMGKIENKDVIITNCGVGKINAACCTQILADKFNVGCIINTGIAGSLKKDVKVRDTVISDEVTYHDVDKRQMKALFPFQECFKADEELVEAAVKSCRKNKTEGWNYHVGRIVSGECFVSDSILKKKIIDGYSPLCVEMEGAAIGHAAYLNKIPFVVIRSISDNADCEAQISYEKFEKISSQKSASIVLDMIKEINI